MARIHYYYQSVTRYLRATPASVDPGGGGGGGSTLQLQDGTNVLLQDGTPILLQ